MLQMEAPTSSPASSPAISPAAATTAAESITFARYDRELTDGAFGCDIDAERDAEQLSVFDFAFDVALSGNDRAELIGVPVTVLEIRFDGEERRGLVARVVRGEAEYTVSLLDLQFVDADLRMQNLLADYRRWVAQG